MGLFCNSSAADDYLAESIIYILIISLLGMKIRGGIKVEYNIFGETMPVVTFTLGRGEKIKSSAGAMKWMDDTIDMDTSMDGGVGGFLKRKLMQESGMLNTYTSKRDDSRVAFGHSYPGHIVPVNVANSNLICQKRAYLCSTDDVELEIAFQQKLGSGFFGGEGLFLTILTGPGKIWLQTMPIQNMAGEVRPYLNINNK